MANQNHLILFISRLMAPMAAKQGAHSRLNTIKEYAATAVMEPANIPQISCPSSATSAKPKITPKVPITFSFATNPVMAATADFQSPQPRGRKSHANVFPIAAKILLSISIWSSIRKLPSTHPKNVVNHTKIVDSIMMVPAFLIKDQPRSHMLLATFPTVGIW